MIATANPKDGDSLRRRLFYLMLVTAISFSCFIGSLSARLGCTTRQAKEAEIDASSLKSWHDTYTSFRRYCRCDDGGVSEAYSDSVATLLASHWDQIEALVALERAHPKFRRFVLHHLDLTITQEQYKAVSANVRTRCPADGKGLCRLIGERLAELEKEATRKGDKHF